ncbi:hypothetical protein AQUCO_00900652v1 [Aquilegia coerulea]|uniref:YABBY protein C-terminal domain-containing protein n=1 Tax=Aquilegia coerulea TaxID=218851 RepID=A0A2G5EEQ8_AQUCA|nr:hypothetical protein AQUCO_00900652v1 [Aquilegia coerulea]
MKALVQPNPPHQNLQNHQKTSSGTSSKDCGSSSTITKSATSSDNSSENREPQRMLPIRPPPEKRQRVPSAYNRFIKCVFSYILLKCFGFLIRTKVFTKI